MKPWRTRALPALWYRFTARVDGRWPELVVSDRLPPPVPFRIVMLSITVVLLGAFLLGGLADSVGFGPQPDELLAIAITAVPLLLIWFGPAPGGFSLLGAYALVLIRQTPEDVLLPAAAGTILLTMWSRWGHGMIILLGQLTLGFVLVLEGTSASVRTLSFTLMVTVMTSAVLGWSIRFFRCRTRLVEQRVGQLETEMRGVRSAERRDLARELHDLVAHDVTATALRANAGLLTGDAQRQRSALRDIADSASGTIADLRRMVSALQEAGRGPDQTAAAPDGSTALDPQLAPPVDSMETTLSRCRQLLEDSDFRQVDVDQDEGWDQIAPSVRSACQRVLREGAVNAVRHGSARHPVRLTARIQAGGPDGTVAAVQVISTVADGDRARARAPEPVFLSGGMGLLALRERVEIFGGGLRSGREGDQWLLTAWVPLQDADLRP